MKIKVLRLVAVMVSLSANAYAAPSNNTDAIQFPCLQGDACGVAKFSCSTIQAQIIDEVKKGVAYRIESFRKGYKLSSIVSVDRYLAEEKKQQRVPNTDVPPMCLPTLGEVTKNKAGQYCGETTAIKVVTNWSGTSIDHIDIDVGMTPGRGTKEPAFIASAYVYAQVQAAAEAMDVLKGGTLPVRKDLASLYGSLKTQVDDLRSVLGDFAKQNCKLVTQAADGCTMLKSGNAANTQSESPFGQGSCLFQGALAKLVDSARNAVLLSIDMNADELRESFLKKASERLKDKMRGPMKACGDQISWTWSESHINNHIQSCYDRALPDAASELVRESFSRGVSEIQGEWSSVYSLVRPDFETVLASFPILSLLIVFLMLSGGLLSGCSEAENADKRILSAPCGDPAIAGGVGLASAYAGDVVAARAEIDQGADVKEELTVCYEKNYQYGNGNRNNSPTIQRDLAAAYADKAKLAQSLAICRGIAKCCQKTCTVFSNPPCFVDSTREGCPGYANTGGGPGPGPGSTVGVRDASFGLIRVAGTLASAQNDFQNAKRLLTEGHTGVDSLAKMPTNLGNAESDAATGKFDSSSLVGPTLPGAANLTAGLNAGINGGSGSGANGNTRVNGVSGSGGSGAGGGGLSSGSNYSVRGLTPENKSKDQSGSNGSASGESGSEYAGGSGRGGKAKGAAGSEAGVDLSAFSAFGRPGAGGSGSGVKDFSNGGSGSGTGDGAARGLASASGSADPEDYFFRSKREQNIFEMVAGKYSEKQQGWAQEDVSKVKSAIR